MNLEKFDPEKPLNARWVWCVDSESSEELLIDLETNRVIAKKDKEGRIVNENPSTTPS